MNEFEKKLLSRVSTGPKKAYSTNEGKDEVYQEQVNENEKAIAQLSKAFAADGHYGWTWHSNIAACIMDEAPGHRAANHAAARFMKLAFGYDSTKQDEWRFLEDIWGDIKEAEKIHSESGDAKNPQ